MEVQIVDRKVNGIISAIMKAYKHYEQAIQALVSWQPSFRAYQHNEQAIRLWVPWQTSFRILCLPPLSDIEETKIIGQKIYLVEATTKTYWGKSIIDFLKGRDGKKIKDFGLFNKLPVELQIRIFELVLPQPRTIIAKALPHTSADTSVHSLFVLLVHPIATPLLHVNRLARVIARERYTVVDLNNERRPLYISLEHDTIHLEGVTKLILFFASHPSPPPAMMASVGNCIQNFQHLTFEFRNPSSTLEPKLIGRIIVGMPTLKSVTLARCEWLFAASDFTTQMHRLPMFSIETWVLDGWLEKWKGDVERNLFLAEASNRRCSWYSKYYAVRNRANYYTLKKAERQKLRDQIDAEVERERIDVVSHPHPVVLLTSKGLSLAKGCVEATKKYQKSLHNTSFTFAPIGGGVC